MTGKTEKWEIKAKKLYNNQNYFDCLELLYKNLIYTKCWIWGLIIFSLALNFGLIILSKYLEDSIISTGGFVTTAIAVATVSAGAIGAGAVVAGAVGAGFIAVAVGIAVAVVAGAVVVGAVGVVGVVGIAVVVVVGVVVVSNIDNYLIKHICRKSIKRLK